MKFPETPEVLKQEIFLSSDKFEELGDLRIRQLIKILSKVNQEIVLEAVIQVFETEDRPLTLFRDQECAGKILEEINPKSGKEIKEIIKRTLKNWDKSIEQLPFWLRDNYGIEKVNAVFDELELTGLEKDKLITMRFWLQE